MKSKFSLVVLGLLAIAALFWTIISGVSTIILAFQKDSLLWLPITGILTGLLFAAIVKLEGWESF